MAPRDPTRIAFADAQNMVDAIWADFGLRFPPRVEKLPGQARTTVASANRLTLFLPAQLPSWCLLHELAHAMSSTAEGASDQHGPVFMGLYARMLVRYLRFEAAMLKTSLEDAGIAVRFEAVPVFLDA